MIGNSIEILKNSSNKPDPLQWAVAAYRRNGKALVTFNDIDGNSSSNGRFIDPSKDFNHLPSRKYLKFTFPLQGGFDGTNIFNEDKAKFSDNAVRREIDNASAQGGTAGPTVAALRKAIDVLEEKSDVDIKLLTVPGIRHESITDYAVESTERRFDAMFIMDIEERDTVNSFVTSSANQIINVSNTATRFSNRNLDSSFAAAYFPDVFVQDPVNTRSLRVPSSVAALSALGYNDSIAYPWFAPAGFNRAALDMVSKVDVRLNSGDRDVLYDARINPIATFPREGVVIFGQKTLQASKSALDRVNVRRLMLEVKRIVSNAANRFVFEQNTPDTRARFVGQVVPLLALVQAQAGIEKFSVQMDGTNNTEEDVAANRLNGRIVVVPTRTVEFISVDFIVDTTGASFV